LGEGPGLVRSGVGGGGGQEAGDYGTGICATLRRGVHVAPAESVSANLIAIHEPDAVAVIDASGDLVRLFSFARNDVTAARLDGGHLVVAGREALERFDVAFGAREHSLPLPSGTQLDDADGGIAVLRRGDGTIMLLRFADGRSFTLAPGAAPRFADLEPQGLYHSYAARAPAAGLSSCRAPRSFAASTSAPESSPGRVVDPDRVAALDRKSLRRVAGVSPDHREPAAWVDHHAVLSRLEVGVRGDPARASGTRGRLDRKLGRCRRVLRPRAALHER